MFKKFITLLVVPLFLLSSCATDQIPKNSIYYLCGSFNDWAKEDEKYTMALNKSDPDYYFVENIDLSKGAEVMVSVKDGKLYGPKGTTNEDDKIIISESGFYNAYLYLDPVSIVDALEKNDPIYKKQKYNEATLRKYDVYETLGYVSYKDFSFYLKEKYEPIYGNDYGQSEEYKAAQKALYNCDANSNSYLDNVDCKNFVELYTSLSYNIEFLAKVEKDGILRSSTYLIALKYLKDIADDKKTEYLICLPTVVSS